MEELLNNPYVKAFIFTAIIVALFPLVAGYIVLLERKVLADLQVRLGPTRVGPYGFLQPLADAFKLLLKEDVIPAQADKWIFWFAPILSTFTALTAFAVLPLSDVFYVADVNIGILFVLAMSSIGILGIILGGWSSNSKYSLLGSLRSAAQMVSYEVPLGFAVVTGLMVAGTLSMQGIVQSQLEQGSWIAFSNYGLMLVPTVLFFISGVAETNRAPFDLPEAESEIVAGFHTEFSGFRFALYFLAEYAGIFVISSVGVTVFFGGWLPPFPSIEPLSQIFGIAFPVAVFGVLGLMCVRGVIKLVLTEQKLVMALIGGGMFLLASLFLIPSVNTLIIGLFWFLFKVFLVIYVFIWFRGIFPRYRYDQLMRVGWLYLIPISIGALIVNAAVLLWSRS
ncbi:MAG: NADH-quinone oxidoreductase subunit H [Solibacterales bacterium]|nr:NADH-quinone oxidoreductase subunit H [Bryobacterales bacterium]